MMDDALLITIVKLLKLKDPDLLIYLYKTYHEYQSIIASTVHNTSYYPLKVIERL